MEPVFDPFEVLSIFAEVIVGQLGFQVVAVAVGRRGGGGHWHSGDTRLFFAMIGCGAFAISLAFSPIFLISELPIFSESNVDFVIINLLIQSAWLLDIYDFGIKLFYYNIIYFCIMSFFFFTRLMTHHRLATFRRVGLICFVDRTEDISHAQNFYL